MAFTTELFAFSALLLFASTIDARKAPDAYWSEVMKDQPLPDATGHLIGGIPKGHTKPNCHDSKDKKGFTNDFEPVPNLTAYHDDDKTSGEESFAKDFEPIPNVSVYNGDVIDKVGKTFVKDFEPMPNISVYHGDDIYKEAKTFVKDSEPRPNVSVYHD